MMTSLKVSSSFSHSGVSKIADRTGTLLSEISDAGQSALTNFIALVECALGYRLQRRFNRAKQRPEYIRVYETFQYVPVIETLEDALSFEVNEFFQKYATAIRIVLYYDDVVVNNKLGIKALAHKIGDGEIDLLTSLDDHILEDDKRHLFVKVIVDEFMKANDNNYYPDCSLKEKLAKDIVFFFPKQRIAHPCQGHEHYYCRRTAVGFIATRMKTLRNHLPPAQGKRSTSKKSSTNKRLRTQNEIEHSDSESSHEQDEQDRLLELEVFESKIDEEFSMMPGGSDFEQVFQEVAPNILNYCETRRSADARKVSQIEEDHLRAILLLSKISPTSRAKKEKKANNDRAAETRVKECPNPKLLLIVHDADDLMPMNITSENRRKKLANNLISNAT
ncbi:hypothetical protein QAD02_002707 [Eretmocerus hayati]|uniref:Uncharacterized protein n=1 Tax=Eretmocerus hayati TaxID=131215 RepID=A0ACC2NKW0_9HYME|nr:hypothetical protein QAD02_002707 [Eretmocerus hayati]